MTLLNEGSDGEEDDSGDAWNEDECRASQD